MGPGSNLCKLDESDAQRPDVHLAVVRLVPERLAQHDLRSHPEKIDRFRKDENISFLVERYHLESIC